MAPTQALKLLVEEERILRVIGHDTRTTFEQIVDVESCRMVPRWIKSRVSDVLL
jgi:hypothetical protein